ncbi:calpastatin [Crenothrix sp. D3]|nr:calpastatin [Crenothrix sp. D3]
MTSDLNRFLTAQQSGIYENALSELKNGRKRGRWMWFIFPQINGLGYSATAKYYAIKNNEEAEQYLNHPVLGERLLHCTHAVLTIENKTVLEIFGAPDNLKLNSCMTLFAQLPNASPVFSRVIDKYFNGKPDTKTLALLGNG